MGVDFFGRVGVLFTETDGKAFGLRAYDADADPKQWNDDDDADHCVTICGTLFGVRRVLACEEQHYFLPFPGDAGYINRHESVTRLDPCKLAAFCVLVAPLHQACLESESPTKDILGLIGFPDVC